MVDLQKSRNLLVAQMSDADRGRMEPHFTEEPLAFKQPLFDQGKPVDAVYFPQAGVVSLVTDLGDGDLVETGTVGYEGLVGLAAVFGADRSPNTAFCQIPGSALVVPRQIIDEERERSSDWFGLLLRFANFVTAMIGQTAACNRLHNVDARMCRWLLMTHDRVQADDFPLTREFLAQMLGVAGPTVNIAGATLQRAGFIKYSRGRITILDRAGLESATCECYRRIRGELAALNLKPAQRRTQRRPQ
jgi:CRP-like cAMP-binding protein